MSSEASTRTTLGTGKRDLMDTSSFYRGQGGKEGRGKKEEENGEDDEDEAEKEKKLKKVKEESDDDDRDVLADGMR